MKRLALVTCQELVPAPDRDDVLLRDALVAAGAKVSIVAWDDASFDWGSVDLALLRSTWDYYKRRDEFLAWIERAAERTRVHNPPDLVRWNTHKGYLVELAAKGLPVTPTEMVKKGERADLDGVLARRGWKKVVLKPAVSAGSHRTMLCDEQNRAEGRAHLAAIVASGDALVQPYNPVVEGYGERSMIVLDGELTHAVRKRPAFGAAGTGVAAAFVPGQPLLENADVDPAVPAEDERETALEILRTAGVSPLYARVDLLRELDGRPVLMELELVEPSLFLWHGGDKATKRLVDALLKRASS